MRLQGIGLPSRRKMRRLRGLLTTFAYAHYVLATAHADWARPRLRGRRSAAAGFRYAETTGTEGFQAAELAARLTLPKGIRHSTQLGCGGGLHNAPPPRVEEQACTD